MRPNIIIGLCALFVLSACSSESVDRSSPAAPNEAGTSTSVAPKSPPAATSAATSAVTSDNTLATNFPVALRGRWRETDGAEPTAAQCDGTANGNIGKVMEVRETRFSIFETGGTIVTVKQREDGNLRAVFDTTYADTPTSADLTFAVDPAARTLTLSGNGPDARPATVYKRCPT